MRFYFKPFISIANLYLRVILKYEYEHQESIPFNERAMEYQFVFKQLTKYCPLHILDVGTGQTALPALMRHCGFRVTAVDNIKDFWPKGMSNRHFYVINDNITETKLNEYYNLITCISVLEHIMDFNAAIQSMFAILKPGGYLILTFPYNEKKYVENVYNLAGSIAPPDAPYIVQAFSRNDINHWVENHNASVIDQEYWQYFTGEYWTVGERLLNPKKVGVTDQHQVSAILLQKDLPQEELK